MSNSLWLPIVLHLILICKSFALTDPIVIKPGTLIAGTQEESYESYLGIPFAKPPINDLRFADPEPLPLWSGTFEAVTQPPECTQINYLIPNSKITGSEDCLYLNVYRPNRARDHEETKPVMVYIHGGAFFAGSSHPLIVGPRYLMDTGDVVLVVLQYRLSALGFLSTGDSASPGNFGLKDQTMALRWVKDNIHAFDGNPNSITIFGQSAGAASAHMHMLSPLSRGLFHSVIALSGSAIGPYNYPTENPLDLAQRQAEAVGIPEARSLGTSELITELRKLTAEQIIDGVAKLKDFDVDPLTLYRTVVEPEGEGAFLTDTPLNLLRRGDYARVPLMTGLVDAEGAVRAAAIVTRDDLKERINNNITGLIPVLMELKLKGQELEEFTQKIIDKYIPGGQITADNEASFIQMYTDKAFLYPHYKQLQIMTQVDSPSPVFATQFNYRGEHSYSLFFTFTPRDFGVVHCDDLIYIFESPALFPTGLNMDDIGYARDHVLRHIYFVEKPTSYYFKPIEVTADRIGYYRSVITNDIEYYEGWKELIEFWDQAKEF